MPFFSLPPCMLIAGYETHRLEDFIYININCLYVLYYHLSKKKIYIYILVLYKMFLDSNNFQTLDTKNNDR